MRLAILVFAAACDLQPPPKTAPAPAPPSAPASDVARSDAGDITAACLDAATNFANVLITGTADQTQRATLEQDRARLVKRTAEACSAKWSDDARACYAAAKDVKDLEGCGKLVVAPAKG
jgi:hypothetical protein